MVMPNKKKYPLMIVLMTLLVAVLACNLPYRAPAIEEHAETTPVERYRVEEREINGLEISITLPSSYDVNDPGADLSALAGDLGDLDTPLTGDLQNLLGGAEEDILVWGYDTASAGEFPVNFLVLKNEDFAAMPLGLISTFARSLIGNQVEILEEQRLTLAGRDTLRWISLTTQAGVELTQAVYLFKEDGILYLVGFNADPRGVYAQLGVFDAIVASLRIDALE
jgi:hypothetical protein